MLEQATPSSVLTASSWLESAPDSVNHNRLLGYRFIVSHQTITLLPDEVQTPRVGSRLRDQSQKRSTNVLESTLRSRSAHGASFGIRSACVTTELDARQRGVSRQGEHSPQILACAANVSVGTNAYAAKATGIPSPPNVALARSPSSLLPTSPLPSRWPKGPPATTWSKSLRKIPAVLSRTRTTQKSKSRRPAVPDN